MHSKGSRERPSKNCLLVLLMQFLSSLGNANEFVAEHTWALIVFVAGLVGWWLMQKVKKNYVISEVDISLFYDILLI